MEDFFEELSIIKSRLCKKCNKCRGKFPTSAWDKMPESCGFEGWLFKKREEIKQKIRKQKELLLLLEISLKTSTLDETEQITKKIKSIRNLIEVFADYGSADW
jgi:hypothetical protein